MKNKAFHVFYLYGIYVTFLSYFLMLFNYFTDFYEPTAFPFILSLFLSGIVYYYLIEFFSEQAKFISIIIVCPIVIAILYQYHIPWLISLLGLGFAYRGILTIISEGQSFKKSSLLTKSLGVGLFAVFLESGNVHAYDPSPYIVMIIQFILFFGGYFLSNWLEVQKDGRRNIRIIGQYSILLGVAIILAYIFSILMKPFRQLVFYSFILLLKPFALLFGPFVQGLIGIFEGWFNRELPQIDLEIDAEQPIDEPAIIEMAEQADFIMPLLYAISIFVSLFFFFRLFKGKGERIERIREEKTPIFEERTKLPLKKFRKRSRQTVPSMDPVRKAMFDFERKAEKYHKERKRGETIQEWFTRIGLEEFSIIPIYETVRYGEQRITNEESDKFHSFLQSTLANWKEVHRNTKKIGKDED